MPTENKLTETLAYVSEISRLMEQEILRSAGAIRNLQHEFKIKIEEPTSNVYHTLHFRCLSSIQGGH